MKELELFKGALLSNVSKNELSALNEHTASYGLVLTENDVRSLTEARNDCLSSCGRVEFGKPIFIKLAQALCSSPYISSKNYTEIIIQIQDTFFTLKNDLSTSVSDDEIIDALVMIFNEAAHGSPDFLNSVSTDDVLKIIRDGDFRSVDMHNSFEWLEGWETWK